ncbi:AI-2E family transporter [Candidatus Contubernalis alkaliaceticus]|uniref:AI-2E family transporter n=1 Tax=Candidatus Contubernalis alkaliaceticus TaxID=338645 RepID=UPI001F4BEA97|nr:AI-2E family transporter [Candidatus Contubernalis alkalaceticus]UNC92593.1 AI-2E family transporter [Candidatus Contubernalis alkalaceticus]
MDRRKIKDIFCYGMTLAGVFLIFIFALLILYGLYSLRNTLISVLFPFLASFIIAYLLNPLLEFVCQKNISRSVGIFIIYLAFFLTLVLLSINVIPSLMGEMQKLLVKVPMYSSQIQQFIVEMQQDYHRFNLPDSIRSVIDTNIDQFQGLILDLLEGFTETVINLFSHIILLVLIPLLVFYILKDLENIKRFIYKMIPHKYRGRVRAAAEDIDKTLGAYVRGQIFISIFVAGMVYVGLLVLGVEFALLLAIINGVTNVIPYFGPIIGAVPAFFIALLESPLLALKVILMITIVQQVESHVLTPTVFGKNLGLHPVIVILSLLAGGSFFGLLGLIFAVPVVAVIKVLFKHLRKNKFI